MKQTEKTVEIESGAPIQTSVIWLHGLGADGHDFAPIVPELKLPTSVGIRFIFPHAPVIPITINNNISMRAWYDIYELSFRQKTDHQGIDRSAKLIQQLIEQEVDRGINQSNIILGGFSQGAVMALITGLTYPEQLGGIIALSGYLPDPDTFLTRASDANKDIPIYMAHGTYDPIVPFVMGELASKKLEQANYTVTWQSFPIAHSACPEEIAAISQWLQKNYSPFTPLS